MIQQAYATIAYVRTVIVEPSKGLLHSGKDEHLD
jgi:hypothetical protein